MSSKKKYKKIRVRSPVAYAMVIRRKGGHHGDKRKRMSKEACRKFNRRNYDATAV